MGFHFANFHFFVITSDKSYAISEENFFLKLANYGTKIKSQMF